MDHRSVYHHSPTNDRVFNIIDFNTIFNSQTTRPKKRLPSPSLPLVSLSDLVVMGKSIGSELLSFDKQTIIRRDDVLTLLTILIFHC